MPFGDGEPELAGRPYRSVAAAMAPAACSGGVGCCGFPLRGQRPVACDQGTPVCGISLHPLAHGGRRDYSRQVALQANIGSALRACRVAWAVVCGNSPETHSGEEKWCDRPVRLPDDVAGRRHTTVAIVLANLAGRLRYTTYIRYVPYRRCARFHTTGTGSRRLKNRTTAIRRRISTPAHIAHGAGELVP